MVVIVAFSVVAAFVRWVAVAIASKVLIALIAQIASIAQIALIAFDFC